MIVELFSMSRVAQQCTHKTRKKTRAWAQVQIWIQAQGWIPTNIAKLFSMPRVVQ
jgi:hypothetical protein